MKYLNTIVLLAFSFVAKANNCVPPEEYSGSHYLGYLALTEREKEPLLMWWRDEYDDDALEPDPRFAGIEALSGKRIFKRARKILRKKKADTYLLAWPDVIYISSEKTEVIKVSLGYSKEFPAYDVAYETVFQKSKTDENRIVTRAKGFDLGCAGNLLK